MGFKWTPPPPICVLFGSTFFLCLCLVFLCAPSHASWVPKFCFIFFYLQGWSTTITTITTRFLIAPLAVVTSTILVATTTTPIKLVTLVVVATTLITITTLAKILVVAITISIAIVATITTIKKLVLQHQFQYYGFNYSFNNSCNNNFKFLASTLIFPS